MTEWITIEKGVHRNQWLPKSFKTRRFRTNLTLPLSFRNTNLTIQGSREDGILRITLDPKGMYKSFKSLSKNKLMQQILPEYQIIGWYDNKRLYLGSYKKGSEVMEKFIKNDR